MRSQIITMNLNKICNDLCLAGLVQLESLGLKSQRSKDEILNELCLLGRTLNSTLKDEDRVKKVKFMHRLTLQYLEKCTPSPPSSLLHNTENINNNNHPIDNGRSTLNSININGQLNNQRMFHHTSLKSPLNKTILDTTVTCVESDRRGVSHPDVEPDDGVACQCSYCAGKDHRENDPPLANDFSETLGDAARRVIRISRGSDVASVSQYSSAREAMGRKRKDRQESSGDVFKKKLFLLDDLTPVNIFEPRAASTPAPRDFHGPDGAAFWFPQSANPSVNSFPKNDVSAVPVVTLPPLSSEYEVRVTRCDPDDGLVLDLSTKKAAVSDSVVPSPKVASNSGRCKICDGRGSPNETVVLRSDGPGDDEGEDDDAIVAELTSIQNRTFSVSPSKVDSPMFSSISPSPVPSSLIPTALSTALSSLERPSPRSTTCPTLAESSSRLLSLQCQDTDGIVSRKSRFEMQTSAPIRPSKEMPVSRDSISSPTSSRLSPKSIPSVFSPQRLPAARRPAKSVSSRQRSLSSVPEQSEVTPPLPSVPSLQCGLSSPPSSSDRLPTSTVPLRSLSQHKSPRPVGESNSPSSSIRHSSSFSALTSPDGILKSSRQSVKAGNVKKITRLSSWSVVAKDSSYKLIGIVRSKESERPTEVEGVVRLRHEPRVVQTSDGELYELQKGFEETKSNIAGIARHFSNGFPEDWKRILDEASLKTNPASKNIPTVQQKRDEINLNVTHDVTPKKAGVRRAKKSLNSSFFEFPEGKGTPECPLSCDDLHTTRRSGRRVIPPLAFWRNQRVLIDPRTNETLIMEGCKDELGLKSIHFKE